MSRACRRLTDYPHICAGIDCWNRTYPAFAIPERVARQNVFAPFAGLDVTAWGAFADGDCVGVALGKRLTESIPDYADSEQGWLSLFAIDPDARNRSHIASELLATVERAMADWGVSRLRFGGDPGQFLPGLPTEFDALRDDLRAAGFEAGRTFHDLVRDISDFEVPARVARVREERPDLRLERVADAEPLLDFLTDQFPGRWRYEAENVTRVPGGESDYWLLSREESVVGFARTNVPDSAYRGGNANWADRLDGSVCGLGPLGIRESSRGRGWGLLLVASLAERYRDAGYDRMVIDWTQLLDYYGKLGFEPWVEYKVFRKEVSP